MRAPGHRQGVPSPVVCGRKFCSSCGRWRLVVDFAPYRRQAGGRIYLDSYCQGCRRTYRRAMFDRQRRNPAWLALHREYDRIWHEAHRRAAGVPERTWGRQAPPDPPLSGTEPDYLHRRLPVEPLRLHLLAWLRAYAAEHPPNGGGYHGQRPEHQGLRVLAHAATVPERTVFAILVGERPRTHYAVADRLAVAMDLPLALIYGGQA